MDEPLPDRLVTEGPYRRVRHPFYVHYILGAVAAPVASIALTAIAAAMVVLTVAVAARSRRHARE